ncbi:mechanosensitive ion channel domain-containing protein [Novipirellula sp. SH528]|uniref:mechanosensitive ion channel family protein n=1 Tax=Novipirellula sp. SH528 TaxID=3454466 RepID=UPI003FA0690A
MTRGSLAPLLFLLVFLASTLTLAETLPSAEPDAASGGTSVAVPVVQSDEFAPQDSADPTLAEPSLAADVPDVDSGNLIEVTVAQQKNALTVLQDLRAKEEDLKNQLTKLASGSIDDGPPYSILVLDKLNDAIAASKTQRDSLDESQLAARESVERSRLEVEASKRTLRQTKENGGNAAVESSKAIEREVRFAEETLALRRLELSIEEANRSIHALELKINERKRQIVIKQVTFAKLTLDEKTAELDVREMELNRMADSLKLDLQYAERRWLAARQEVDSLAAPNPSATERVEALSIAKQTIQVEQAVVNQRLQRLPMMRASWDRRYRVATGQSTREERRVWLTETLSQLEQLSRERRTRELKLTAARASLDAAASKADEATAQDPERNRWLDKQNESWAKQIEQYNRSLWGIDSASRALTRLQSEIEGEPSRSLGQWIEDAWGSMRRVWNYELTNIDDTSLTVGKVASTFLFIIFGYFAARWLSRLMGTRLPKFGVEQAAAGAIESLSFYALLITFALTALRYANVPLTMFTFLGGAIAIGVGFGSQNILNNFISGLILLAERPIKSGDLILIDQTYGNVTRIGARSTMIRTGDNLDIIVPNSKFLENNVTNLTRTDDRLRSSIKVGVAYGSQLDKVMQLLEQAASENPGVHPHPKPSVSFNDFGDSSLAFQVFFWVTARNMAQMRTIETQVRLGIDRLFREHGVVIAYPQQDLHLQSHTPIEFRLINEANQSSEFKAAG